MSFISSVVGLFRCRSNTVTPRSSLWDDERDGRVAQAASRGIANTDFQINVEDIDWLKEIHAIEIPEIDDSILLDNSFFEGSYKHKEIMRNLFKLTAAPITRFMYLDRNLAFRNWIESLLLVQDVTVDSEEAVCFAHAILNFMRLAESDPEFKLIFLDIVNHTDLTSKESMEMSLITVGREYRLSLIDDDTAPQQIASTLVYSEWMHGKIERFAEGLFVDLASDEISQSLVYLDLLVGLNQLGREIRVDIGLSNDRKDLVVLESDIKGLYDLIFQEFSSENGIENILLSHPEWIVVLEDLQSSGIDEIKSRMVSMRIGENPSTFEEIDAFYQQSLIALTKEVLGEFSFHK
ncbi:MAG: hypothetical protein FJZ57_01535 [Chlamydiae bacterium]|nr:hypothetical protein [Chlamydiota bacterium]